MAALEDIARLRLEILGDDAEKTVATLKSGLKDVNSEMKLLELNGQKGSDEWKALRTIQRDIDSNLKEMSKNIDINNASLNELANVKRRLNKELGELKIGSAEWLAKLGEVSEVDTKLNDTRKVMKGIGDEGKDQEGFWVRFKANFSAAFAYDMVKQAAVAVFDFGKEAVAAYNEAAQSSAQLDASLESTGHAAGLQRGELDKLSESLAKKTRFDDDAINSSQALLLTFTDIKKGVYEQAVPAILDMAEKMGGNSPESLKTTSIQVGKALNDPINGMTALKKVGVTFSEEQKRVIKTLQDTGDMAGAQKVILAELSKEFGGSAEAAAKAGTGGLTVLANRLGNVKENIGGVIVSLIEKLYPAFDFIAGVIEDSVTVVSAFIIAIARIPSFIAENKELFIGFGVAILSLNAANILATGSAIAHTVAEEGRAIATKAAAAAQWLMNAAMTANPIGLVIAAIASLVAGLIWAYNHFESVRTTVGFVWGGIKALVGVIAEIVVAIANLDFSTVWDKIKNGFVTVGKGAIGGYRDALKSGHKDVEKDNDTHLDNVAKATTKSTKTLTDEQIKAAKKSADERKKANNELQAKLEDMQITAIKNETDRLEKAENLRYTREKASIEKSKSDIKLKQEYLELAEKTHQEKLDKIKADAAEKDKKRQEDYENFLIGLETDAQVREVKNLQKKYQDNFDNLTKLAKDKDEFAIGLKQIDLWYDAELEKIQKGNIAREDKNNADIEKLSYDSRKNIITAALLQEGLGNAEKLRLKKELLTLEYDEDVKNLEATSLKKQQVEGLTAGQIKAIKAWEVSEKLLLDGKYATDSKTIDEDSKTKKLGVFGEIKAAWKALMDGNTAEAGKHASDALKILADFGTNAASAFGALLEGNGAAFYSSLSKMTAGSNAKLSEALGVAGQVAGAITAVIDSLINTFSQYWDLQILKSQNQTKAEEKEITARKDAQLKGWKEMYDKGTINKEEYESAVKNIEFATSEEIRKKRLAQWYEQKKATIKMAKIESIAAFVKTMGTMGLLGMPSAGLALMYSQEKIKMMESEEPPESLMPAGGGATHGNNGTGTGSGDGGSDSGGGDKNTGGDDTKFAKGAFIRNAGVPEGPSHSEGGIGLWNKKTGQYLGEMEGKEPIMILSKVTYANNKDVIHQLMHSSLHKNGARIYKQGGAFGEGGSYINFLEPLRSNGFYAQGNGSQNVDYSFGSGVDESRAITQRSFSIMDDMKQASVETAQSVDKLYRLIQNETNGILNGIREKPTGISLHDLTSALESAMDAESKSNL